MPETAIYYDVRYDTAKRFYKVVNGIVTRLNSKDPNDLYVNDNGTNDTYEYDERWHNVLKLYDAQLHGGKKLRKKSRKNRKHKTKSAKKRTARKH
jgi:hypothetical protein